MQIPRKNHQRQPRARHQCSNSRSAYELTNSHEARGREDGHAMEDWLGAEEEITTRRHALSPPNITCVQSDVAPTLGAFFM